MNPAIETRELTRRFGYVAQHFALYPDLTRARERRGWPFRANAAASKKTPAQRPASRSRE
jgi:hypothetical protein